MPLRSLPRLLVGPVLAFAVAAVAQSSWTLRYRADIFSGLCWTGSQYIAVGRDGAIHRSPDGEAWTRAESGTRRRLSAVVWTGTMAVVVGDSGTVLTSPDGSTWSKRTLADEPRFAGLAWSGSRLVATSGYGPLYTSLDAVTWTSHNPPISYGLGPIVWAGSQFVVSGGSGIVVVSADGMNWTQTASPSTWDVWDLAWDGMRITAVGPGVLATSLTGQTWNTKDIDRGVQLFSAASSGNRIVVGGGHVAGKPVLLSSGDGVNWQEHPWLSAGDTHLEYAGGRWIGMGWNGMVVVSDDGLDWKFANRGSLALNSVAWSGKELVAVGENILSSPDGIRWTSRSRTTDRLLGEHTLNAVAWAAGLDGGKGAFVAAGYSDSAITSPDGAAWTTRRMRPVRTVYGLAWTGKQLVAVGVDGDIQTSPDGQTWTHRDAPPDTRTLLSVASDGDRLAAVGNRNVVSEGGAAWTAGEGLGGQALARIGNLWVAVGLEGSIQTSIDGLHWTARNSGTPHDLLAVAWAGSRLVAVGEEGVVVASTDGIHWIPQPPIGTDAVVKGLVWTGSQLVAVGANGEISTAPVDAASVHILPRHRVHPIPALGGWFQVPYRPDGRRLQVPNR